MIDFLTDPLLRGPTLGSMLMCLTAGVVGVFSFVQRRSLIGETLAHATYPGVTLAVVVAALFGQTLSLPVWILVGASLTAVCGLGAVKGLTQRLGVRSDTALCLVLSLFFGLGTTIASYAQTAQPAAFRQIQVYLYGQAATMTDRHILLYGGLALLTLVVVGLFYKELQAATFDREYARSTGIVSVDLLLMLLTVGAVVIGIRTVGVVLMAAMLIAPAASARQYTHRLSVMLVLAGGFGLLSGLLGNVFSWRFSQIGPGSFPTGPMIVLVGSALALFSLLFAPKRGLVFRYGRIVSFRLIILEENLLKALWRSQQPLKGHRLMRLWLQGRGLLRQRRLTPKGERRGARIVRLHRLWELYLVTDLGFGVERVHKSAEEIEHLLTPELEAELTQLLSNPKHDPHKQPIPSHEPLH